MTPRVKKFIGLFILLPGLLLYFGGVVSLADRLPDFWVVKLVYFIVTGLGWALPVIPMMKWVHAESGAKTPDRSQ